MPCTCEDAKDIYRDSYDDVVERVITVHSDWSDHEIRVEAANIFRPRYRLDKASELQEAEGLSEYEGASFTLTSDGKIFYPQYGKYLDEFHESQRRQRPHEYSVTEHQTSRLIEDVFRQGATEVTTVYAREGNANRDIVHMEYDPKTRIGKTTIINTHIGTKEHSFDSIHHIAQTLFSNLHEAQSGERVFVLSDKPLETHRVDRAASSSPYYHYDQYKRHHLMERTSKRNFESNIESKPYVSVVERVGDRSAPTQVFGPVLHIEQKILRDTEATIVAVKRYWQERQKKKSVRELPLPHTAVQKTPDVARPNSPETEKKLSSATKSIRRHEKRTFRRLSRDKKTPLFFLAVQAAMVGAAIALLPTVYTREKDVPKPHVFHAGDIEKKKNKRYGPSSFVRGYSRSTYQVRRYKPPRSAVFRIDTSVYLDSPLQRKHDNVANMLAPRASTLQRIVNAVATRYRHIRVPDKKNTKHTAQIEQTKRKTHFGLMFALSLYNLFRDQDLRKLALRTIHSRNRGALIPGMLCKSCRDVKMVTHPIHPIHSIQVDTLGHIPRHVNTHRDIENDVSLCEQVNDECMGSNDMFLWITLSMLWYLRLVGESFQLPRFTPKKMRRVRRKKRRVITPSFPVAGVIFAYGS